MQPQDRPLSHNSLQSARRGPIGAMASWESAFGALLLLLLIVVITIIAPRGRQQVSVLPDVVLSSLPPTALGIPTSLSQHSLITRGVLWGGNIFIKVFFITAR